MGLSGRKEKQRIGKDPRNLTWADDAAKFGQSYLSKMGWDPSQGLGVSGDGRTSHIKVAQKLNLFGIGAGAQQGPDGVSWKQNREYEMLLKRLNESTKDEEPVDEENDEAVDAGIKRKREEGDTEGDGDEKRKRKKEKKDKKEKKEKKREKRAKEEEAAKTTESSIPEQPAAPLPAPRPMAHRARFLRSKKLAALSSSTAVAEILGIASSGSATPVSGPSSIPATPLLTDCGTLTPITVPETDQELTTARKSVADYFKEKLAARALVKSGSSGLAESSTVVTSKPIDDDAPRAGLGSSMTRAPEFDSLDTPRVGLGSGMKFGSLMGTLAPSPASASVLPSKALEVENLADGIEALLDDPEKLKKKEKKDKKKKQKVESAEEDTPISSVMKVEAESIPVRDSKVLEEEKRREKAERKMKKRDKKEKRIRKETDSS